MNRSDPRAILARLGSERRGQVLGLAAGLLLGGVVLLVVAEPSSGLALLALALAMVFLVARPHWAVLAIFVMAMFRLNPVRVGPLSASELLAALLVLPLVVALLRDRTMWVCRVPEVRLLLGIAGVLIAATTWSLVIHPAPPLDALDRPWDEVFFFGQSLLLLFYFVYFIKTPRHVAYAVAVVLLMVFVAGGEAVASARERAGTDYLGGFTGNENRLAHFCLWGTALLWSLRYKGPPGWWRRWTIAPLLVLPLVTLMTGSRSGLVQLAVLGGLILLEQRQWSPAQRIRACALVVTIGLVTVAAAPTAMLARASDFDVGGATTIGRLRAVETGIMMVAENPLFGVGPGNFQWRYQMLTGSVMSAHNAYVWAILSGGPLLLILYLLLFHRCYRSLRTLERTGPEAFVWLATALRLNLVLLLVFSFFATVWTSEVFWLLMWLTIVLVRLARARPPATLTAAIAPPRIALR
jgi:O-antigen ligase